VVDGSQTIHENIVLAFFSRSSWTFSWRLSQMIQKSFLQKKTSFISQKTIEFNAKKTSNEHPFSLTAESKRDTPVFCSSLARP